MLRMTRELDADLQSMDPAFVFSALEISVSHAAMCVEVHSFFLLQFYHTIYGWNSIHFLLCMLRLLLRISFLHAHTHMLVNTFTNIHVLVFFLDDAVPPLC